MTKELKFEEATEINQEVKPKRRGRPKGSKNKKPRKGSKSAEEAKKEEPNIGPSQMSLDDEIEALAGEYKSAPRPESPTPEEAEDSRNYADLVNGTMLLIVTEAFLPAIALNIVKFVGRKRGVEIKVPLKALKMTAEEKESIMPIADEAAKYVLRGMTPLQLYVLCVGGVYVNKLLDECGKAGAMVPIEDTE